jgi:hypothetical protein
MPTGEEEAGEGGGRKGGRERERWCAARRTSAGSLHGRLVGGEWGLVVGERRSSPAADRRIREGGCSRSIQMGWDRIRKGGREGARLPPRGPRTTGVQGAPPREDRRTGGAGPRQEEVRDWVSLLEADDFRCVTLVHDPTHRFGSWIWVLLLESI